MAKRPEHEARPQGARPHSRGASECAAAIERLTGLGIDFQTVAAQAGKPDADPFDLLCYLAFPPAGLDEASARRRILTRRQRADQLKKQQAAFFTFYAPEAREVLNDLLKKYTIDGEVQFTLPDVLKVAPIWRHGNVAEICPKFGGPDELRNAVGKLQSLLYAS